MISASGHSQENMNLNRQLSFQEYLVAAVLLAVMLYVFQLMAANARFDDLHAIHWAGRFFELGAAGIYAGSEGTFFMKPPDLWVETALSEDANRAIYPFIYPPIWAWISAQAGQFISFEQMSGAFAWINPVLVCASWFLAIRIAGGNGSVGFYLVIAFVASLASLVISLPLEEGQPQIIVSFLILAAIERDRAGRGTSAGLLLALAASIKLYPAIFAIFWLAAGRKQSVTAFLIFGAAFGLLSIAVAGWPLHQDFLAEVSAISKTALLSFANFSLDPLVIYLTTPESELILVSTDITGGKANWRIVEKPAELRLFSGVVQAIALAALVAVAFKSKITDPMFWPLAFVVVAWLSPLSWVYHYMTAFVFLPALIPRLGYFYGLSAIILATALTSSDIIQAIVNATDSRGWIIPISNFAIVMMGALFILSLLRPEPPRTDLHPGAQRL